MTSFRIEKSDTRQLKMLVTTFGKEVEIELGKTNLISFKSNKNKGIEYFEFYDDEDCLEKMIKGILNQDIRLERI